MNEYKTVSPKDALASSALNASYQRVKIFEHLMERRDHPTVAMVYDAPARKDSGYRGTMRLCEYG